MKPEIKDFKFKIRPGLIVTREFKYRKTLPDGTTKKVFQKTRKRGLEVDAYFTAHIDFEVGSFVVNGIYIDEHGTQWVCVNIGESNGYKEMRNMGIFQNLRQIVMSFSGPPKELMLQFQAINV